MSECNQAVLSAEEAVERAGEGLWGKRGALRLASLRDAVESAEDGDELVLYTRRLPSTKDLVGSLLDAIDEMAMEDTCWDFTANYVGDELDGSALRESEAFVSLLSGACEVAIAEALRSQYGTHYETRTRVIVTPELFKMTEGAA